MNDAITAFTLAVPQADLEDLDRRIDQTRWPDAETVDDWTQGAPLAKVKALVDHWRHRYDWRRCEAMLNDWGPGTATSSARLYWESFAIGVASARLEIPVGVSVYPRETLRPSRRWVDRWMPNLIHYNILDRGGHFAAWEQPALHAKEIRDCFAKVRRA